MRKFLFAVLFYPACLLAQKDKLDIKVGEDYTRPSTGQNAKSFTLGKAGYFSTISLIDDIYIRCFDSTTLALKYEQHHKFKGIPLQFQKVEVARIGNNMFALHTDWDKGLDKQLLYADKIDAFTGELIANTTPAHQSAKTTGMFTNDDGIYDRDFNSHHFFYDGASTKMMYVYRLAHKRYEQDRIGIQVFDAEMKKIWGSEFEMPFKENELKNTDFYLNSKGEGFLVASVKNKGTSGQQLQVLKFSSAGMTPVSINLEEQNIFIGYPVLKEYNDDMLLAGTYTNSDKSTIASGLFLGLINRKAVLNKLGQGLFTLPLEELQKFETPKRKEKLAKDPALEGLQVSQIQVIPGAGLFILVEEKFFWGYSSPTVYEDLYAFKIDPAGKTDWVRKISKNQYTGAEITSKLIIDNTGYYVLYMDNLRNRSLKTDEAPFRHDDDYGGYLVLTRISPGGETSKEWLMDTFKEGYRFFMDELYWVGPNKMFGRTTNQLGKKSKPILIKIN